MKKHIFTLALSNIFITTLLSANYYCETCREGIALATSSPASTSKGINLKSQPLDENEDDYDDDDSDDNDGDEGDHGSKAKANNDQGSKPGSTQDKSPTPPPAASATKEPGNVLGSKDGVYNQARKTSNIFQSEKKRQAAHLADHELIGKIKYVLGNSGNEKSYLNVDIHVLNGTILLTGYVENEEIQREIHNKIKRIDGVLNIEDQIAIKKSVLNSKNKVGFVPSSSQKRIAQAEDLSRQAQQLSSNTDTAKMNNDMELAEKVQDVIKKQGFIKGGNNITFSVSNRVVSLNGIIDSESEKQRVGDRVKSIDGVRSVQNNITVQHGKSYTY